MARVGLILPSFSIIFPTTFTAGWFEPMSVELHQTGTLERRSTDWATAPRQITGTKTGHLWLLDDDFPDYFLEHDLLSLGPLLGGFSGRSRDRLADDVDDHDDVAQPEQDPDDQAWKASLNRDMNIQYNVENVSL